MKKFKFLACLLVLFLVPISANAVPVNPIIVYNGNDGVDVTELSGTVDINQTGVNSFTVLLTNTSTPTTGDLPADATLTGYGFETLAGINILSGEVVDFGGANFTNPEYAINTTWGYDNTTPFNTPLTGVDSDVNRGISTLSANVDNTFVTPSGNIDGPRHGIAPGSMFGSYPNFELIDTWALFEIVLDIPIGYDDWFDDIVNGDHLIAFGSPTAAVPEPATLILLGTGLVGLAGASRKKFKK